MEQTPRRSVTQSSNRRSRIRTNTKLVSRRSSCERVCSHTSNPGALIASIASPPSSRRISSELWRETAICACANPPLRFKPGGVVSRPSGWCWPSGRRSPRGSFKLLPDDLCKGEGSWRCTTPSSSSKLVSLNLRLGVGLTPGPGIRGAFARKTFRSNRIQNAAIKLQSLLRGAYVYTCCYRMAR